MNELFVFNDKVKLGVQNDRKEEATELNAKALLVCMKRVLLLILLFLSLFSGEVSAKWTEYLPWNLAKTAQIREEIKAVDRKIKLLRNEEDALIEKHNALAPKYNFLLREGNIILEYIGVLSHPSRFGFRYTYDDDQVEVMKHALEKYVSDEDMREFEWSEKDTRERIRTVLFRKLLDNEGKKDKLHEEIEFYRKEIDKLEGLLKLLYMDKKELLKRSSSSTSK